MIRYCFFVMAMIGFCCILFPDSLKAQQLPQYSQYMINEYMINPAVAGKNDFWEVRSNSRYQWRGIVDAPRTYVISTNGSLPRYEHMGLGGFMFMDITGPTRRTGLSGSYAYHLKAIDFMSEEVKVSMALTGGLLHFAVDGSQINLKEVNDAALIDQYRSVLVPDFGFATHIYTEKYFLGITLPQLFRNKLNLMDFGNTTGRLIYHWFISGGYKYDINTDFRIEPSILVKYAKPEPIQMDISGKVTYREQVWAGLSVRTKDAFSVLLGYIYKDNLNIGYAYDFTFTNIRKYSTGSHEIVLGFKFLNRPEKALPLIDYGY